jgi:hypothetical protein
MTACNKAQEKGRKGQELEVARRETLLLAYSKSGDTERVNMQPRRTSFGDHRQALSGKLFGRSAD